MRQTISFLALACALSGLPTAGHPAATVESNGQHPRIKLSQVISGHLTELNGKYQLRVTEVTNDPGGYIGPHNHVGPGIRCITSGALTYVEMDKPTVYHAGDCFFEPGDMSHTAKNNTQEPVVLLNFEVLPASLTTGSTIPVPVSNKRFTSVVVRDGWFADFGSDFRRLLGNDRFRPKAVTRPFTGPLNKIRYPGRFSVGGQNGTFV